MPKAKSTGRSMERVIKTFDHAFFFEEWMLLDVNFS